MADKVVNLSGLPQPILFPEGTTDEQVMDSLNDTNWRRSFAEEHGYMIQPEADVDDWEITKGVKTGMASIGSGVSGAIAALGQKVGAPEVRDWAKEQMKDFQYSRSEHQGDHPSLESIGAEGVWDFVSSPEKLDGFLDWALFNFGNGAATTIPAILGGVIAAGGAATATPAAVIGGNALMYGYGLFMGAGEGYEEALSNDLTDEQAANIGLAIAPGYAALERLGAAGVAMDQVKRGFKLGINAAKGTVKKATVQKTGTAGAAERLKTAPSFVRRMAGGFGKGALAEGLTEAAQEALIGGSVQTFKGNMDYFKSSDFWKRLGEAGAAGAIAGGPLAAMGEAITPNRDLRPTQKAVDNINKKEEEGKLGDILNEDKAHPDYGKLYKWMGDEWTFIAEKDGQAVLTHKTKGIKKAPLNDIELVVQDVGGTESSTEDKGMTLEESFDADQRDLEANAQSQEEAFDQERIDSLGSEEEVTEEKDFGDIDPEDFLSEEDAKIAAADAEADRLAEGTVTSEEYAEEIGGSASTEEAFAQIEAEIAKNFGSFEEGTVDPAVVERLKARADAQEVAENQTATELPAAGRFAASPEGSELKVKKIGDGEWVYKDHDIAREVNDRGAVRFAVYYNQQYVRDFTNLKDAKANIDDIVQTVPKRDPKDTGKTLRREAAATLAPSLVSPDRTNEENGLELDAYMEAYATFENSTPKQLLEDMDALISNPNIFGEGETQALLDITDKYPELKAAKEKLLKGEIKVQQESAAVPKQTEGFLEAKARNEAAQQRPAEESEMQPETAINREAVRLAEDRDPNITFSDGVRQSVRDYKYSLTWGRATVATKQAFADLRKALDLMGLKDIKLVLPKIMTVPGYENEGSPLGRYSRGLIEIALDNPNSMGTLRHEAIHALSDMGLFTKGEWGALRAAAKQWRKTYQIDTKYKRFNLTEAQLDEEAIAAAYEVWAVQKDSVPPSSRWQKVFQKIKQFLQTIADTFGLRGLTSIEDVFLRVDMGMVGVRPRPTNKQLQLQGALSAGQPSTKERIKNLTKWFGRSVVTKSNGEPRIVYHATVNPELWENMGLEFSYTQDLGFHFGTQDASNGALEDALRKYSSRLAKSILGQKYGHSRVMKIVERGHGLEDADILGEFHTLKREIEASMESAHTLPAYIKMEEPLYLPDLGAWNPQSILNVLTEGQQREKLLQDIAQEIQYLANMNVYYANELSKQVIDSVPVVFSRAEAAAINSQMETYWKGAEVKNISYNEAERASTEIIKTAIQNKGYDGVIYRNLNEREENPDNMTSDLVESYIVFNPTQIKSVHNYGTYEENNPNFMYSMDPTSDPLNHPAEPMTPKEIEKADNLLDKLYKKLIAPTDAPQGIKSASTLGNFANYMFTPRMLASTYSRYGKMWTWLERIKSATNEGVNRAAEQLRLLGAIKQNSESWKKYQSAMEIAIMNPTGGTYRPEGYLELTKEEQAKFDWTNATITFTNPTEEDGGTYGGGRGSTVVPGQTTILQGELAQAYVQTQNAMDMVARDVLNGFLGKELGVINRGIQASGHERSDEVTLSNLNRDPSEVRGKVRGKAASVIVDSKYLEEIENLIEGRLLVETNPDTAIPILAREALVGLLRLHPVINEHYLIFDKDNKGETISSTAALSHKAGLFAVYVDQNGRVNDALSIDDQNFQARYLDTVKSQTEFKAKQEALGEGVRAETSDAVTKNLREIKEQIKDLRRNVSSYERSSKYDYVPRSRWGSQYFVAIQAKRINFDSNETVDGTNMDLWEGDPDYHELIDFDFYEAKPLRDRKVAQRLLDFQNRPEFAGKTIVYAKTSTKAEKMQADIIVYGPSEADHDSIRKSLRQKQLDVDTLFGLLGSSQQKQYADARTALSAALGGRGFSEVFEQRKNIAGYEIDFDRSIAQYVSGMSRLAAELKFAHKANDEITKMKGKLAKRAQKTYDYVLDPNQEYRQWRLVGFLWYLGGNLSSAVMQLFTLPLFFAPYMTMITGTKGAPEIALTMAGAFKDVMAMASPMGNRQYADVFLDFTKGNLSEEERGLMQRALEDGVIKQYALMSEIGLDIDKGILSRMLEKNDKLSKLDPNRILQVQIAGMFSTMETAARLTALLTTHRLLKNKPDRVKRASEVLSRNKLYQAQVEVREAESTDPYEITKFVIDENFGLYGKLNRAPYQSDIGTILFQFQSYPQQMLEMMGRMIIGKYGSEGRKALAMILLMIFVTSGLRGLPGFDDGEEYMRWARRKFGDGIDQDMSAALKDIVADMGGGHVWSDIIEKGMLYGLTSVDIQQRIGFGSLPGSAQAKALLGIRGDIYDALGVPGQVIFGNMSDVIQMAEDGRLSEAWPRALPLAMKNAVEGVNWYNNGVRSKAGTILAGPEDINAVDALFKGLGFMPKDVTKGREQEFYEKNLTKKVDVPQQRFSRRLGELIHDQFVARREGDTSELQDIETEIAEVWAEVFDWNKEHPVHERVRINMKNIIKTAVKRINPSAGRLKDVRPHARAKYHEALKRGDFNK